VTSARREWKREPGNPVETNRRLIEEWLEHPKDFLAGSWIPIHSIFRVVLDATGGCAVYPLEGRRLNELLAIDDDREPHQFERKLFAEVVAARLQLEGEALYNQLLDFEKQLQRLEKGVRVAFLGERRDDIIRALRQNEALSSLL
jgi:hypothetical protein